MNKYTVQMFGLPHEATELTAVEIELADGASLKDVIAALRRQVPTLEGYIIRAGEDRLAEHCGFNINGRFYFENEDVRLQDGDRIALLTIATGG